MAEEIKETNKLGGNTGPGKRLYKTYEELVEPKLADIYQWRCKGMTITDIASKLGIGKTTFYEWQKQHPEITDVLKEADLSLREKMVAQAQKSLLNKLKDRTVTETVEEKIVDENGEIKTKNTTKKRKVLADTTAIIFTLRNTDPDVWNSADSRLAEARIKKIDAEIAVGSEEVDMNKEILSIFRHYGHKSTDDEDEDDIDNTENVNDTE